MRYWKIMYAWGNSIRSYIESETDPSNSYSHYIEGTKEEYEHFHFVKMVVGKADKGQEAENAIELNDAIKTYTGKLLREQEFLLFGNLKDMILRPNEPEHIKHFDNNMKLWRAYNNMLDSIGKYERNIAIATNLDTSHPIDATNEKDFVNILGHIKEHDQTLWSEITKMLKVEITYEPEAVKNEYIKLQQIINSHIAHPTPATGTTLSSEMPVNAGGTQGT